MRQTLAMLALAFAMASCSGVQAQAPGKIYEFDAGSTASMRGYYILRGWQFYDGLPPKAALDSIRVCGAGALALGAAIHEISGDIRGMCLPKPPAPPGKSEILCEALGMYLGRPLKLVHTAGPMFYCGEPGQKVTGA